MPDPTCPSCGLPLSDAAFEAGSCPCCDFPFAEVPAAVEVPPVEVPVAAEIPIPVAAPRERTRRRWPVVAGVGAGTAFACGILAGYLLFARDEQPTVASAPEIAVIPPVKPLPAQATAPTPPIPAPTPVAPVTVPEPIPPPKPVAIAPPPKPAEKPIVFDPADGRELKFDAPEGTAEVVELNGDDRIVLTGRVKVLKLNAVNGSIQFDASGLEAEEIVLAGDINGNCTLKFGARNGRVTIRGLIVGSCMVAVNVPGGTVTLAEAGRIGGGASVTLAAKTVDAKGVIDEGAKVLVTLSSGGTLRVASMDGGASVTYKRSAPSDPAPTVETGDLRSGTRVVEGK